MKNEKIVLRITFVPTNNKDLKKEKAIGLFFPYDKDFSNSLSCDILVGDSEDWKDTLHHEITHFLMYLSGKNMYSHGKKFKKILKLLNEEL